MATVGKGPHLLQKNPQAEFSGYGPVVQYIFNVHEWDNDPKALFPNCVHQTLSPEE